MMQVNLIAIANVIVKLFEESEMDTYWLFSSFAKLWETKLAHIDKMVMVGLKINSYMLITASSLHCRKAV